MSNNDNFFSIDYRIASSSVDEVEIPPMQDSSIESTNPSLISNTRPSIETNSVIPLEFTNPFQPLMEDNGVDSGDEECIQSSEIYKDTLLEASH